MKPTDLPPPAAEPRRLGTIGIEIWSPVPGTSYEASNLGRVRNVKTGREIGTCRLKNGYYAISGMLVHRAVLAAFDGPQPARIVGRHLNDDRGDNRLANLAWGTRADNAADTARAGRGRTRTGAPVAPLDLTQADAVFDRLIRGEITQQDAARALNRSAAWVSYELRARSVPLTTTRDPVNEDDTRRLAAEGVEVWVRAVGSHGLDVSNLGRVRNARTGTIYALRPERRSGYVKIPDVGLLHRVVLTSFSDEPFPGAIVRHDPDPDRANCALHNLRWGTYADNGRDTVAHGRSMRGEQHPRATLTDERVAEGLRLLAANGWTTAELSAFLGGIGQGNASDLVTGRAWAHVERPPALQPRVEQAERRRAQRAIPLPPAGETLDTVLARVADLTERARAGTFRLPDDDYAIVTRDEIIRATREDGRDAIEARLLPAVFAFFRAHVAAHGWFYPTCTDTLGDTLRVVAASAERTDDLSSRARAGTAYLHARFPSFWDVNDGPVRAFADDRQLNGVLRYRLGLNNSKDYTYTLADGEVVTTRETFPINVKAVRRGFVVQRRAASFFKPSVACAIYQEWITGTDAPVVWDPSCGFGARLLGFAAAFPRGIYVGNDPATRTHADVSALGRDLVQAGYLADACVLREGSELPGRGDPGVFDLVFTSPPYFDLERYYDEPGQCWRDYPTPALWRDRYLRPTFDNAHRGLRAAGRMVVNVDEARRAVVVETAHAAGFTLIAERTLALGRDHFARKRAGEQDERGEPVLVFART
jgi:hypothetical protein